ncbi:MAG: DUF192 domain-containing protein [archaeon]|nr:DUF192 domain-containing protein [archaeon]
MLKNNSTNQKIIEQTKIASNFFSRFKGLMFETKHDYALIFVLEKESIIGASIHMMFVFSPIDIVYLNSKKQIIDLAENIQPWILNYSPKKAAKYFIELPNGLIKKNNLKLGQEIVWS